MKHSRVVIGNSSSGIVEAPVFHVPTVNIGDRQKGRLQSNSIINCGTETSEIVAAIKVAMSNEHMAICSLVVSPYGTGNASELIAKKMVEIISSGKIDLKKKFYDLKGIEE